MTSLVVGPKDVEARLGVEHWNIVKETVHLIWTYGQKDGPLAKGHVQEWNGMKMYQSFFRLDCDDKDFQVVVLLCDVFLRLSEKAL
jgi:hypothetical protein